MFGQKIYILTPDIQTQSEDKIFEWIVGEIEKDTGLGIDWFSMRFTTDEEL